MPAPETPKITQWLGLRNTVRPERQPFGAMASANNVVLTDDGEAELVPGFVQALSLANITDAYEHWSGEYALVVAGGALYSVSPSMALRTLRTGLTDTTFTWTQTENRIAYVGSRGDNGIVTDGTAWSPLSIAKPRTPTVVVGAGTMPAGDYQVGQVYRHIASGKEGPASLSYSLTVDSDVSLVADPGTVPAGYETDIYVTVAGGTTLRYLATSTGEPVIYNVADFALGGRLDPAQDNAYSLPPNTSALAFHETALFAAVYSSSTNTSFITPSRPFFHTVFGVGEEGFAVPGTVRQMLSAPEGLLLATDCGVWLRSPDDGLQQLANYGCPPGTPMYRDRDGRCAVWTVRGLHTFPPFKNEFDQKLSVVPGSQAYVAVSKLRGSRFALVSADSGGTAYNPY